MKILVVSYFDDNYGDMLIRICFTSLLKIVLKNLNIPSDQYTITLMPLKVIDEEAVCASDCIFFAGGALFGLNYENFFASMQQIIRIADDQNIPVIFSSMGANNKLANSENEIPLYQLLQKTCIRAISVRDNISLFQKYCKNDRVPITQVCDPAVWTGYVYGKELPGPVSHKRPVIGINVVRGGLFRDNGLDWGLSREIRYLDEIRQVLEEEDMDYRFYTNGSLLDNNTLRYFAEEKSIAPEKVILNQTTRDLVHTVAGFDAVLAIRMHSSIISYSLGIPSVNLVWHEKIPLFYQAIGQPGRAVSPDNWTSESLREKLHDLLGSPYPAPAPAYAMSLYEFLFQTMKSLTRERVLSSSQESFTFEEITALLKKQDITLEEDLRDLNRKVLGGERKYFRKFKETKNNEAQIMKLQNDLKIAQAELARKEEKLQKAVQIQNSLEQSLKETRQTLKETRDHLKKVQSDLDHINSHLSMRAYHKIKKLLS